MSDRTRVGSTLANLRGGNFDPDAEPVASVEPGEPVVVETISPYGVDLLTSQGVPRPAILEDEVTAVREGSRAGPGPHVVTGPVHVEGAEPGDVLEVRVREVELRTDYAVNSFGPSAGVLSERFDERDVRVVRLDRERGVALLDHGIEVPLAPFFGILAVAPPPETGRVGTVAPSSYGGNLDVPVLGEGSTVYLPVNVAGAHFYAGDGHAAQGEGEVNATALETSLTGSLEFAVHGDVPRLEYPVAETDDEYVVPGLGGDLDGALEHAVARTVAFLRRQHDLPAKTAYRLCSVAVDFRISQAVNGNVGVHALVPKAVLDDGGSVDPRTLAEPAEAGPGWSGGDR